MTFAAAAVLFSFSPLLFSRTKGIKGQTIYVPVYSQIYHGSRGRVVDLAVTLSIHNTDMKSRIIIDSVDLYDTSGKLVRRYFSRVRSLAPLETVQVVIAESDTGGGTGANFIVRWRSERAVNAPLIESVMIGTSGQQGISFMSRGVPVEE